MLVPYSDIFSHFDQLLDMPRASTYYETPTTIELKVPGYGPEHIKVYSEGKLLTVEGTLGDLAKSSFSRQYKYSREIDPQKVYAECKHGILTIRVNFYEAEPEKYEIEVKGK